MTIRRCFTWNILVAGLALLAGCAALDSALGVPADSVPIDPVTGAPIPAPGTPGWMLYTALGIALPAVEGLRRGYVAHRLAVRGASRAQPAVDALTARMDAAGLPEAPDAPA